MPHKILVVEDEPSMLNILNYKFTQEGFTVIEAKDGEEGLAMALREHPDLILLDIILPKMDGVTMLSKLREDQWGKSAKVIVLTNLSDATTETKSAQKGATDYLIKTDWQLDDLVEKVKSKLSE